MSIRSLALSTSLRRLASLSLIWTASTVLIAQPPLYQQGGATQHPAPADTILEAIWKKIGSDKKRLGKLAGLMTEQVHAALSNKDAGWMSGLGTGEKRPFNEHPYVVTMQALAQAARECSGNPPVEGKQKQELLKRFPWPEETELKLGMAFGADTPLPPKTINNSWVPLGEARHPFARLVPANVYSYGWDEILSTTFRITGPMSAGDPKKFIRSKLGKRTKRTKPVMISDLPPWELVRTYLEGSLPVVRHLSLPWLKHLIHSRLAARRRADNGGILAPMDERLAYLDSRWQGYYYANPLLGRRKGNLDSPAYQLCVFPTHTLIGLAYGIKAQLKESSQLASYLPNISDPLLRDYAIHFLGLDKKVGLGSFFRGGTREVDEIRERFFDEKDYLFRYKRLVDLIVEAADPSHAYSPHLSKFDFPDDAWASLSRREDDQRLFMPRRTAVLVWQYVDRNPIRLADLLYDEFFKHEQNRFPAQAELERKFWELGRPLSASKSSSALTVRAMLEKIADRLAAEFDGKINREQDPILDGRERAGDFGRQCSPFPQYELAFSGKAKAGLDRSGMTANYLVGSVYRFHLPLHNAIRGAALRCLREHPDFGEAWLSRLPQD